MRMAVCRIESAPFLKRILSSACFFCACVTITCSPAPALDAATERAGLAYEVVSGGASDVVREPLIHHFVDKDGVRDFSSLGVTDEMLQHRR